MKYVWMEIKVCVSMNFEKEFTETNIFFTAIYKVNLKKNIDWSESLLIYT